MRKSKNPGVSKPLRRPMFERLIIVQVLELQHAALLKCARGEAADIDELNDAVRSLLSQLVEHSDGTS